MLWLMIVLTMTLVGVFAGSVLGKRASAWCPDCGGTSADFAPRPFALRAIGSAEPDDADPGGPSFAWGMTLPDGSVVTVDWRSGPSSGVTLSASPDRAAFMHGADLVWLPAPTRSRTGRRAVGE